MRESTVTNSDPGGGFAGAEAVATIGREMAIQERVLPLMTVTEAAATKIKQLMSEEQVVVDPFSAPYLQGAEIDYVDSIQAAGFAINNPNAVSSCGCGHSFQVEEGDTDATVGGCGSGCSA